MWLGWIGMDGGGQDHLHVKPNYTTVAVVVVFWLSVGCDNIVYVPHVLPAI